MDAIAERRLGLRTPSGNMAEVTGHVSPREVRPDEWTCACRTSSGSEERSRDIHGGDSMQALQLAMATLDGELLRGAERRGGTLYWFDGPFVSVLENSGMNPRDPSAEPQRDAS